MTELVKICTHCRQPFEQGSRQTYNFQKAKFCGRVCYRARQGSPEGILDRFWSNVVKTGGCWLYQNLEKDGYGYFRLGPQGPRHQQWFAHRFAWTAAYGPIPDGLEVCHKCDVRNCVRPEHLFLGTHDENMADCSAKGRAWSKLSADDVREIKRLLPTTPQKDLAKRFNISPQIISSIHLGKLWRQVQPLPQGERDK